VARGPSPDALTTTEMSLDLHPDLIVGGGMPLRTGSRGVVVPVILNFTRDERVVEFRSGHVQTPGYLARVEHRVGLPLAHATFLLDRDAQRWLMYSYDTDEDAIFVCTVPLRARVDSSTR